MTKPNNLIILSALFFIDLAFRVALISQGPYYSDCLLLAVRASEILETGQMHYLQGSGLPLTALLGAVFIVGFNLLGQMDPVLSVNFMSVACASVSVVALYLFVERNWGPKTAIFSAILLTFNPLMLGLSSYGNSQMPALMFFLFSLYSLSLYVQKQDKKQLYISALLLGLMGACRLQDMVVTAVIYALFLMLKQKSKKDALKNILTALFVSSAVILFFYIPALPDSSSAFQTFNDYIITPYRPLPFFVVVGVIRFFLATFSPLELIAGAIGMIIMAVKKPRLAFILFILLILPFGIFINIRSFVLRFMFLSVIPLIIFAAYCLSHHPKKAVLKYIFLVLVFGVLIVQLNRFIPTIAFRHHNSLLPDYFKWVAAVTEDNAYIIERDHSLFIQYYARRKPLSPLVKVYGFGDDGLKEFQNKLDFLLEKDIPVYITKWGMLGYIQRETFVEFFSKHYSLTYMGSRPVEDWHIGVLFHHVLTNDLYRVRKK